MASSLATERMSGRPAVSRRRKTQRILSASVVPWLY